MDESLSQLDSHLAQTGSHGESPAATPADAAAPDLTPTKSRSAIVPLIVGLLIGASLVWFFTNNRSSGSPQPVPNESTGLTPLDRGLAAHSEGRIEEAKAFYIEALKEDPSDYFAQYNLGVVAHGQDPKEAITRYRAALQTKGDFPPALLNLALLLAKTDEPGRTEAVGLYKKLIAIEPKNAQAHMNLGVILLERGNQAEAESYFTKAVALDPRLAREAPPAQEKVAAS